ncbi:hypothetical protein BSL82_03645 [Tardibacter chloracetimidivorans]|uniref:HTH arsR-type domain-containing protein n=1 Tax=Tardibacter chloracetimidivorans TaxID=1921510 RepID=A0A1L3ZSC0_9SPHN|nr:ArsR family transcriptional regulator [Tardibacter chloracetimidivorans]API58510.1 hypothetical protein BSL82_03645 [Tardibacter chloracetimidivorans]
MADKQGRRGLTKGYRHLTQIQAMIGTTIPMQLARTFYVVALNEGKSLHELAKMMGISDSTVSRHLLDLGERNRRMEPGYGLVERTVNPSNLKQNFYTLTPRGRQVAEVLADLLED